VAIVSVVVNVYVAAEILLQEDDDASSLNTTTTNNNTNNRWFVVFASSLAALVSLVVALREMAMLLDGTEQGECLFFFVFVCAVYILTILL
jgi:hypothetical protein